MWRRNGGRYLRLLWRRRGSFQLRAHAGRLVHSSVPATVPPWAAWASQPILRHSNEDKDLEAVSQECTPEDRRHAAELLFQKKKEAYFKEVEKYSANPHAVFTNNEFSLKYINVYGFDLDYTLVQYSSELHKFTYERARDTLISKLNYPATLQGLNYDPEFAIRGLHCDSKNGLLMKIDAYNYIQKGSVYRGHSSVSTEELDELYGGLHVPMRDMDRHSTTTKWNLTQLLDMFSLPETALFADISQYLMDYNISYDPGNLYQDIQSIIYNLHISGQLHNEVASDMDRYLTPHSMLPEFLGRLRDAGKQLFIVTNSPYSFLTKVMRYLMKADFVEWSQLFDVIVVGARKPSFYLDTVRPFRLVNSLSNTPTWGKVEELCSGKVYQQGNVRSLIHFMDWHREGILYFGDHVFSDLAEPILHHGWRTGAIIPELREEITTANTPEFKHCLAHMLALESLLKKPNVSQVGEEIVDQWKAERGRLRLKLKHAHNSRFGSVFRTEKSPTYFSRRLASFSNLYTSGLENLLQYSMKHTFIPRRAALPHEPDLNFDL